MSLEYSCGTTSLQDKFGGPVTFGRRTKEDLCASSDAGPLPESTRMT